MMLGAANERLLSSPLRGEVGALRRVRGANFLLQLVSGLQ